MATYLTRESVLEYVEKYENISTEEIAYDLEINHDNVYGVVNSIISHADDVSISC